MSDVAVAIDHSGSMGEICSADPRALTKHQAVLAGLQTIAARLTPSDMIDLWEFDNAHRRVGVARAGNGLQSIIGRLVVPRAGPRSGLRSRGATAQSKARDVLLVTDGKSHALEVQALARTGRRFSVVLVGEDSLEANVGHLAALTVGQDFRIGRSRSDLGLAAALRSLRTRHHAVSPISGEPQHVSVRRAGMTLTATWQEADGSTEQSAEMRAVAALAGSFALPALEIENAAQLAEAEGLVTHLTSLVLVDEAADVQEGIPATRKVALPAPRLSAGISVASMALSQANDLIFFAERRAVEPPPPIDRALRCVDLSPPRCKDRLGCCASAARLGIFQCSTEKSSAQSAQRQPSPRWSRLPESSPFILSFWSLG